MEKSKITLIGITSMLIVVGILYINAGEADQEKEITSFLESFRTSRDVDDFEAWASHWKQSDGDLFTSASKEHYSILHGWNEIYAGSEERFNSQEAIHYDNLDKKINIHQSILIEGKLAWVYADEIVKKRNSEVFVVQMQVYTLEKVDGKWKILSANYIHTSSYHEGKYVIDVSQEPEITHVHRFSYGWI